MAPAEARSPPLADAFVARLAGDLRGRAASASELDVALADAFAAAQAEWPGVSVSARTFAAYLGERIPPDAGDVVTALLELRTSDLYLACACAAGERPAIDAFESRYAGDVDAVLVRIAGSKDKRDEVLQLLRDRLFVAPRGDPPAITRYSGRSGLRTWLNATVVRLVLNFATRGNKEVPVEEDILAALPAAGADPELEHFKRLYATEFRAALSEAVAGLASRERNLLRYAFADGLTIDQVGALYGVHRATAGRWINGARQNLLVRLRRALMSRLRVDGKELESIVRMIQSRIDVSLRRVLGDGEGEGG